VDGSETTAPAWWRKLLDGDIVRKDF
jgi:hypothetical protein